MAGFVALVFSLRNGVSLLLIAELIGILEELV